ncbi:MAG TPA: DUF433 domain-containing protein [Tepidisphaeraceae bacterium]|nr:DUF433 domain-containing protein [Tepidisphaeraceae bacterium]
MLTWTFPESPTIRPSWAVSPAFAGCALPWERFLACLLSGHSREKILQAYPYLESPDIDAVLAYAAWRMEERD